MIDRPRWKRTVIVLGKAALAALVLWGMGRQVLRTWSDLARHELAITFCPSYLIVSAFVYLAGLSCCALFYHDVLQSSRTPIGLLPALRAYLISHLGKYVPGKAMVVVMRAGMSAVSGARPATAAIATTYETLVMMAAGGLVAAIGFALCGPSPYLKASLPLLGPCKLQVCHLAGLLGLGMGLPFLFFVLPPVFRRLSHWISMPLLGVGPDALPRLSAGLLLRGLARAGSSWLFLGLSQLAVTGSLVPARSLDFFSLFPVMTASVALATVAGFAVAVLPGGLGVREGVLIIVLGPSLGSDLAVVSALLVRLVWVAAELLAAAALSGPWSGALAGARGQGSSGLA